MMPLSGIAFRPLPRRHWELVEVPWPLFTMNRSFRGITMLKCMLLSALLGPMHGLAKGILPSMTWLLAS